MAARKRPLAERFHENTSPASNGCVEWTGTICGEGYGRLWVDGSSRSAHRISWELQRGPIPAGLHIDHLCRNRRCVNPDHLEPVEPRVNIARSPIAPPSINSAKVVCKAGHQLEGANLDSYALKNGRRSCIVCCRARWRKYYYRRCEAA